MAGRVRVAVLGAGVVGLSSAVCVAESLQDQVHVTLVSDKFSPNTTSDGAAGILFASEFPEIPVERQRRWFKDSFDHLLKIALSSEAPKAGVLLSSGYQIFREVPMVSRPFWSDLVLGFRDMTCSELQMFPSHKYGQAFTTIKCECETYLPWLLQRFLKAGGSVQRHHVSSLEDLCDFDVVINCSGLSSRTLAADQEVFPVRGQVLKLSAPWLQHFVRDGDGLTYIYPGTRGVTVGGTRQAGDDRLQVDPEDTEGILQRCRRLEPSLLHAEVQGPWVGLRPSRRWPRVGEEGEEGEEGGRKVLLLHNYGHGGWGVTLAWGCAVDMMERVKRRVQATKSRL